MSTLDFGLFGLDVIGGLDKDNCLDNVSEFQDILGMSLDNLPDNKKDVPQTVSLYSSPPNKNKLPLFDFTYFKGHMFAPTPLAP